MLGTRRTQLLLTADCLDAELSSTAGTLRVAFLVPPVDAVEMEVMRTFTLYWSTVVTRVFASWARGLEWKETDDALRIRDIPLPPRNSVP